MSSVLQGSVLGGVLFNIFIDDIDDGTDDGIARKFADDTKVARIVENERDGQRMQNQIDNLTMWAQTWEMQFNIKKCKVIHCGRNNPRIKYNMGGTELGQAREERDLGIIVDETLKPSRQCAAAAKSGNFALGQLLRAFHFRKKSNLIPLFKTFVRPRLEFAASAWSPWTEVDARPLERVQERLIRALSDARGQSYDDKLRDAGLTTLKERRERGDMIEVFKTLRGVNKVRKEEWFSEIGDDARPTRANTAVVEGESVRKEMVVVVERANLELRRNFFSIRAANAWNKIPENVKTQKNVNAFKNAYDAWRQGKFQNEGVAKEASEASEQERDSELT